VSYHAQGRAVYEYYCYQCHAYAGDAATLASTYLEPAPRNFTASDPDVLLREQMIGAVTHGREGTAMVSFSTVLGAREINAVVDYIRAEFMQGGHSRLRYHTAENGWDDHQRYADAFPFASGEIALDTDWEELTPAQKKGKRLFMKACISCHDRARVKDEGPVWELRALSYPRRHYNHTRPYDAITTASPYALHDRPLPTAGLTAQQQRGAQLFQENCAFCHAADATGRNWIGSFLEPRPRDLTRQSIRLRDAQSLAEVIREGLPGTSMPAWKYNLADEEIDDIIAWLKRTPLKAAAGGHPATAPDLQAVPPAPRWEKTASEH
jgi:cytochrome c oxidase cbb3-type subunit 3